VAAGALGMRVRSFLASGGIGRIARFAVIAWAAREMGAGLDLLASTEG
jgi:membrane protein YqaA with SNARE-associated domain